MPKTIQSGGFWIQSFNQLLSKFSGQLMKVASPLAKNVLAPLAAIASFSAIDSAIQWKLRGKGATRAEKGITLVISNEDRDR